MALLRMAPSTTTELLDLIRKSAVYCPVELDKRLTQLCEPLVENPRLAGNQLMEAGILTAFQLKQLLKGKHRGLRLGEYRLLDKIGEGGMGAVYLAQDESLHRLVAIKVLSEGSKRNPLSAEHFVREARSAAALIHPNIVSVYYFGVHESLPYLAMEFIEGRTLDEIVTESGPMDPVYATQLIAQAAAGLQHAHNKGFIHRDIKPGNLIVSTEGVLKILDMGLARCRHDADRLNEVCQDGQVVGTADFISPEQAVNSPDVDIRSDIYSLGATFFLLCTGKPPFEGTNAQKLAQHLGEPAPAVRQFNDAVPEGLAEIIARMLAKSPAERFDEPAELIDALRPWLPGSTMALESNRMTRRDLRENQSTFINPHADAAPTEELARPSRRKKDRRLVTTTFITLALAGVCVVGAFALESLHSDKPKQELAKPSPSSVASPPGETQPQASAIEAETQTTLPVYELNLYQSSQFPTKPGLQPVFDPLPIGWLYESLSQGTPTECTVEPIDDRPAITIQAHSPKAQGRLVSPTLPIPFGQVRLRLCYRTSVKVDKPLQVKFRPNLAVPGTGFTIGELAATHGAWHWTTIDADLNKLTFGRIIIQHDSGSTDTLFALSHFQLSDIQPSDANELYDFQMPPYLDPFVATIRKVAATGNSGRVHEFIHSQNTRKLPEGWGVWPITQDFDTTYFIDGGPKHRAIGMQTVGESNGGAMVLPILEATTPTCRVYLYYQNDSDTDVMLVLRPEGSWKESQRLATIPRTGNAWQLFVHEIDIGDLETFRLALHTQAMRPGEAFRLREVHIIGRPKK